ncbi:MAG: tetratricopeptide repeat protein [Candidatus Thermoplasmatota archaeon]|jgi:tetratricopeptide (TPR) repeat protein/DNA-binding MarR family transcriptional regulator|nr:tetratricopeptide repeat protein [Candidatus Thermoplasmatota archaeon]
MQGLPRLTIEEKVLLVLVEHLRYMDEFQVPPALTQDGLSELIGVNRPNIARSLKALRKKGLIEERLSHVQGQRRRKKVYMISPSRTETALKLRSELGNAKVTYKGKERSLDELASELEMSILRTYLMAQGMGTEDKSGHVQLAGKVSERHFFGRESELVKLQGWLKDPRSRFAVLCGMGGIGKTALLERFCSTVNVRRCIWYRFVQGSSLKGVLHSLEVLLEAPGLGLELEPRDAAYELGRAISGNVILVLDDLHLAGPDFLQVLSSLLTMELTSFKVLAASRKKRTFYSARESAVEGRVLEVQLEGLDENGSMELLGHRGFEREQGSILFKRSRGYPMALMLAPVGDLSYGEEFGPDAGSFLLSEVIGKLPPEELSVLRLLSILRVPTSRAHSLVNGASLNPVSLDELISRSLVSRGQGGYEVHPVISDLVRSRTPGDIRSSLHSAAADHYLTLDSSATGLIEASHHLVKAGRTGDLFSLLEHRGLLALEEGFMELLLVLEDLGPAPLEWKDKAWYYLLLGTGESCMDEHARAVMDLMKALDAAKKGNVVEPSFMVGLGTSLGRAHLELGRPKEAMEWFLKASDAFMSIPAPDDQDMMNGVWAKNGLGLARKSTGDLDGALSAFEGALSLSMDYDPGNMAPSIYGNMASVHMENGHLEMSLSSLDKGLVISDGLDDRATSARLHEVKGEVFVRAGESGKAVEQFERALELSSSREDLRKASEGYLDLARTDKGPRNSLGHRLVSFIGGRSEGHNELTRTYNRICGMERAKGQMPSAEVHRKAALLFREAGMDRMAGKALNNQGYALALKGDKDGAIRAYRQALELLKKAKDGRGEAITTFNLGNLLAEKGDGGPALELMTRALSLMRENRMEKEAHDASLALRSLSARSRKGP